MEKQKLNYLNEIIKGNRSDIPSLLYKYRPFDQYTYDMLENSYLFLAAPKTLDDPSECTVSFDLQDFYNIEAGQLTVLCVDCILDMIRPYTSEDNLQRVREITLRTISRDGNVQRNLLLEASFDFQKYISQEDSVALVNWFGSIPERINSPEIRTHIEKAFFAAYEAREEMGICSLTELSDCEEMWENYTNGSSGYCVEYDMENCEPQPFIFPVFYQDVRENNIVMTIVSDLISQLIFGFSHGEVDADRSHFVRMFLTKETKWAYQKEWRIIGDANWKEKAPPIRAIHLGKNVSESNKKEMEAYCKKHNIPLISKSTT